MSEAGDYRQKRCRHGWVDVSQCEACKTERALANCKAVSEIQSERVRKLEVEIAAMKVATSLEPLAKRVESTPFQADVAVHDDYEYGVEHGLSLAAAIIREYESELDRNRGSL
jgi:hypothetical protein